MLNHKLLIVTAALPYVNGSIHLGHLVGYCQVDIYVRALQRLGMQAVYICADDAHGTPIEMNAFKYGVSPEDWMQFYHEEHKRDFAKFGVEFTHFGLTHNQTNEEVVLEVYKLLQERGFIVEKEVEGNWCAIDQRFLPDRFIRGTCPRCGALNQYGDVCEVCGSTYTPSELKEAACALCGNPPAAKISQHLFFKLSDPKIVSFLQKWIDSGSLTEDTANYVRNWLDSGLKDWCITRDGPYFGFKVPDRPDKFFYVWLDAPLGYVAAVLEWGKTQGLTLKDLWQHDKVRIEHVIGKDIVYFHTLFWPAVLQAIGYTLPSKVHVHGMLTIDGAKMSKSRGTFIKAQVFAKHIPPEALRYYYACKYTSGTDDLELAFEDLVLRVNGELVNKHANLFSRVTQFIHQKLGGSLGTLPFSAKAAQEAPTGDGSMLDLARTVVATCKKIEKLYPAREFAQVVKELGVLADIGNEFMQTQKPWDKLVTAKAEALEICTFVANICQALAMYLWPIVPNFATAAAAVLQSDISQMDSKRLFQERERPLGKFARLFERLDSEVGQAIIQESQALEQEAPERLTRLIKNFKQTGILESPESPSSATVPLEPLAEASQRPREPLPVGQEKPETLTLAKTLPLKTLIDYEQFQKLDLRVGTIEAVERIPKSKKLLRLQVDLGEGQLRQIVAGIALAYPEAELVARLVKQQVVVVANLAPTKIMGVESCGMILASGEAEDLSLLSLTKSQAPGTSVR